MIFGQFSFKVKILFRVDGVMADTGTSHNQQEVIGEAKSWHIPLEGDIVPLEDVEESNKEVVTTTVVGKIIFTKFLNRKAIKETR